MQIKRLEKEQWMTFIEAAFQGDRDIVSLYDRDVMVETVGDVCVNVFEKLSSVDGDVQVYGVSEGGQPAGYFAFTGEVLVSFGLSSAFRTAVDGRAFYEAICSIQHPFSCYLFTYNQRAIRWLQKMGMTIVFNNVTLLQCQ